MNSPEKFEKYAELLREWAQDINLVSASTLSDIENRHIADSAQLADVLPRDVDIVDLGSGAGFPGVVLAILGWHVTCTESVGKKVAFLSMLQTKLELQNYLRVYNGRVENFLSMYSSFFDKKDKKSRENLTNESEEGGKKLREIVFTARAFAPLDKILDYVRKMDCKLYLLKGRDVSKEIAIARRKYYFDYRLIPSKTGDGFVLVVDYRRNNIVRKFRAKKKITS